MAEDFEAVGMVAEAPFSLKLHRGDGMTLVAMNWRNGRPPDDFVGFAIEYREPGRDRFFTIKNRITFEGAQAPPAAGKAPAQHPSLQAPIQKFRWVHFPRNAELSGDFVYRVTPVFMNRQGELSFGVAQQAAIALARETHPGAVNVAFTRGFISSQAFIDRFEKDGPISTLLPPKAAAGLDFAPKHPRAKEALDWMGFEARKVILELLDEAKADGAKVRVVAYDLSLGEIVAKLQAIGRKLKIIIDNSDEHGKPHSGESLAAARLAATATAANVKRQKMKNLQHNKIIIVDGPNVKKVVCGSTNFAWRGFFVQNNNALVLEGQGPVDLFMRAFKDYWDNEPTFGATRSALLTDAGLPGLDVQVAFSPHDDANALLQKIADDVGTAESSVFYSLAFLHQTGGPILQRIKAVTASGKLFAYGIADKKVGTILRKPDGNEVPVFAAALDKTVPEPFRSEPTGGAVGTRMHHKFVVIDFDKPSARVYTGSYNFSDPADSKNGENLVVIRDRKIAVSYMIEALRIFDHYHFRVAQADAKKAKKKLVLKKPPAAPDERPWWHEYYSDRIRIRDRELFA